MTHHDHDDQPATDLPDAPHGIPTTRADIHQTLTANVQASFILGLMTGDLLMDDPDNPDPSSEAFSACSRLITDLLLGAGGNWAALLQGWCSFTWHCIPPGGHGTLDGGKQLTFVRVSEAGEVFPGTEGRVAQAMPPDLVDHALLAGRLLAAVGAGDHIGFRDLAVTAAHQAGLRAGQEPSVEAMEELRTMLLVVAQVCAVTVSEVLGLGSDDLMGDPEPWSPPAADVPDDVSELGS